MVVVPKIAELVAPLVVQAPRTSGEVGLFVSMNLQSAPVDLATWKNYFSTPLISSN